MTLIPILTGIALMGLAFLIGVFSDEPAITIGNSMLMASGLVILFLGVLSEHRQETMHRNNINPTIIEYIVDVRNQKDETSITTDNAIAIYIECKRNGLTDEETISFLLPDITKEEAKSIVKTYNLLGKEN